MRLIILYIVSCLYLISFEILKIFESLIMYGQHQMTTQNGLSVLIIALGILQIVQVKKIDVFPIIGFALLSKLIFFPYSKSPEILPLIIVFLNTCFSFTNKATSYLHVYLPRLYVAFIYLISAYEKMQMNSWVSGSALQFTLAGVFSTDVSHFLNDIIPNLFFWQIVSWGIIGLYIFSIFLLFDRSKIFVNILFIFLHASIFLILDLKQVSLGMILVHVFISIDRSSSLLLKTTCIKLNQDTQLI